MDETTPHSLRYVVTPLQDGFEVDAGIIIRDRIIDTRGNRSAESLLLELRERMARTLGCKPERIMFINRDESATQTPKIGNPYA